MSVNIYIVYKPNLDTYIALQLYTIIKGFNIRQFIKNQALLFTITLFFLLFTRTTLMSSWKTEYYITLNS